MKLTVETHKYAPELNRVHFVNKNNMIISTLPAPGITNIAQARSTFFARVVPGKAAIITASYDNPDYQWLESHRAGRFQNYAQLKEFVNKFAETKKGGALLDGGFLPDAKIKVRIKLIG